MRVVRLTLDLTVELAVDQGDLDVPEELRLGVADKHEQSNGIEDVDRVHVQVY